MKLTKCEQCGGPTAEGLPLCPLDTGELENCAECVWAPEQETED